MRKVHAWSDADCAQAKALVPATAEQMAKAGLEIQTGCNGRGAEERVHCGVGKHGSIRHVKTSLQASAVGSVYRSRLTMRRS